MSDGPRVVSGTAPGKLILFGEHAVVYGHPAVAVAVDRGTQVQLEALDGPTRVLAADISDPRLDQALAAVLPAHGVGIRIRTDLPVGRGMGSSAALAVALVRALAAWEGTPASVERCLALGFEIERVFHGRPSGLDHTVSTRGGAIRYRRTDAGPVFQPIQCAPLPLVVLDTGIAGDTAQLVAGVGARRPGIDPVLARIGQLVDEMIPALAAGDLPTLGAGMTENQSLLQQIGVSSPEIEALVALAVQHGALGAKLAGAGGGGVVIALVPDPAPLLAAARARGVDAITVQPGPPVP